MIVKLLTEHHLECLNLKGGCRGSSESTHVKMPHCWKSIALAHLLLLYLLVGYNSKSVPYRHISGLTKFCIKYLLQELMNSSASCLLIHNVRFTTQHFGNKITNKAVMAAIKFDVVM